MTLDVFEYQWHAKGALDDDVPQVCVELVIG
jgi:hypothetical protein